MTPGNSVAAPARMAGRQAHKIAAVVSIVDQRVAGALSHVASIVKPKCLRLLRRIIEVMQTLVMELGECQRPQGG